MTLAPSLVTRASTQVFRASPPFPFIEFGFALKLYIRQPLPLNSSFSNSTADKRRLLHFSPIPSLPLLHLRGDMSKQEIDFDKSVGHSEADQPVSWNRRDLLLYSVGIGANEKQLDYVYEQSQGFRPFPTYPIVLGLKGTSDDITVFSEMIGSRQSIPGFPSLSPNTIVHGEQSLEILHDIPTFSGPGWKLRKRVVAVSLIHSLF